MALLQPLLATAGYLIGTLLHGALLRLLARRPNRRPAEPFIAALVACLFLWNATNLAGSFAELLTEGQVPALRAAFALVSVPALALAPSFLLHAFATMRAREGPVPAAAALVYLGPLGIAAIAALSPAALAPALAAWVAGALLAGAALGTRLARSATERPEALPGTTHFYRFVALSFLAAAALAALAAVLLGRGERPLGTAVEGLVVALSTLPSLAAIYAAHRYYGIRPPVPRGAVNVGLAMLALAVYLLGISSASHALEGRYGWNVRVVEGLGIVALVFLFHPFRRHVLESLVWVFDPRGSQEMAILRGLAADLTRPGASNPAELAARVASGVEEALSLERAGLAVTPIAPGGPAHAWPAGWIDYAALLEGLAGAPGRMLEVGDAAWARPLVEARVERVRPLFYDGDLVGALVLGRHADSTALDPEDVEAVESIAGPIAAACTSVRLYEQRLGLERRLADTQRLAGLGRLSATVAHRVKNPLASIKAIAQAMREDLGPEDARRQDLAIVVEEVDRLSGVVSQLLGFARGAPGGEPGPVDVRAIADDVVLLMQHQAAAAGVRIELRAAEGLSPVLAEATALREALANLVENAILASPPGASVSVELAALGGDGADRRAAPRRGVRVRVSDRGPGVPPEVRPRLFEPFFTTRPGGTGLGLAVTRQRVEAWGGRAYLEEPNGDAAPGARFAFELRAAEEGEPAAAPVVGGGAIQSTD